MAVKVADAEGLTAVSMRRIAAEIGTGPASLYRYVSSRDELIDLMVDATSVELDLSGPPSGDPIDDLIRLAHQIRGLYRRHRWLLDVGPDQVIPGPNTVNFLEYALSSVRDLDIPGRTKLEAVAMLSGIVALFVRGDTTDTGTPKANSARRAAQAAYLEMVLAKGDHPCLVAALTDQMTAGTNIAEDRMTPILRRILSGLLHQ